MEDPLSILPAFKDVCRSQECEKMMEKTCNKMLACDHACCGFKDEVECLPCLNSECVKKDETKTLSLCGEEFCSICYVDGLN